jgi:hypothetical protein
VRMRDCLPAPRKCARDGDGAFLYQGKFRTSLLAAVAAAILGSGNVASGAVIYFEGFDDTSIASPGAIANGTVASGFVSFADTSDASRSRFSMVRTFTEPAFTISFDVVAPVFETAPASFELLLRAGTGTSQNTLSSSEDIIEALAYRTATPPTPSAKGNFQNNGNETIFVIANNDAVTSLTIQSPIDGTDVTLNPLQYIAYVRNNTNGVFGLIAGATPSNYQDGNGATAGIGSITRFGIGSSSNGNIGGFGLDNVLVMSGATFDRPTVPEPSTAAMGVAALATGVAVRRRMR